jgi:hypothetical protein
MSKLGPQTKQMLRAYRDSITASLNAHGDAVSRLEKRLADGGVPHPSSDVAPSQVHLPWSFAGLGAGAVLKLAALAALAGLGGVALSWSQPVHAPMPSALPAVASPAPAAAPTVVASRPASRDGAEDLAVEPTLEVQIKRPVRASRRARAMRPEPHEEVPSAAAQEARPPSDDSAPQTAAAAATGQPRAPSTQPVLAPESRQPPPSPHADVVAPPEAVSLDAEMVLMRRAAEASKDKAYLRALAAVEEHQRKFPDGKLSESRDVTRLLVLCALGRDAEVRQRATRFVEAHPASVYLAKVASICRDGSGATRARPHD